MGRPKGSKNKPKTGNGQENKKIKKVENTEKNTERKRGRPKGRKSSYTVSEKALAQRKNNFAAKIPETEEEMSFNNRLIQHIMEINEIATHADRHDLLSLRSCFIAYLKLCQKNNMNVANLAAYGSMGMDYPSFAAFSKRDDPEIRAFCKWVRETCAMFREAMVSENKLNPVIGIFWQRNFDGLRNDTEQVMAMQEQDDNEGNNTAYKEKYRKLVGGSND